MQWPSADGAGPATAEERGFLGRAEWCVRLVRASATGAGMKQGKFGGHLGRGLPSATGSRASSGACRAAGCVKGTEGDRAAGAMMAGLGGCCCG